MADKIAIVHQRGTTANVDPDALEIWLADKKEGWTVVKPAPAKPKADFVDHDDA